MFSRCFDKRRITISDNSIRAEDSKTGSEVVLDSKTLNVIHSTLKGRIELGISPNFEIETSGVKIALKDNIIYYSNRNGSVVLPLEYVLAKRNLNTLLDKVYHSNSSDVSFEVTKLKSTVKILAKNKLSGTIYVKGEFNTDLVIAGAFDFFPSFKIETDFTMESSTLVRGISSQYVMFSSFDYRKHPSLVSRVLVPRKALFNELRVCNPKGRYSSKIVVVNDYGM